jgi:hypothetical protein
MPTGTPTPGEHQHEREDRQTQHDEQCREQRLRGTAAHQLRAAFQLRPRQVDVRRRSGQQHERHRDPEQPRRLVERRDHLVHDVPADARRHAALECAAIQHHVARHLRHRLQHHPPVERRDGAGHRAAHARGAVHHDEVLDDAVDDRVVAHHDCRAQTLICAHLERARDADRNIRWWRGSASGRRGDECGGEDDGCCGQHGILLRRAAPVCPPRAGPNVGSCPCRTRISSSPPSARREPVPRIRVAIESPGRRNTAKSRALPQTERRSLPHYGGADCLVFHPRCSQPARPCPFS